MVALSLYGLALLFATWASFSLTDPNLFYINSPGFVSWQQWMWQTFFVPAHNAAWLYGITVTVLWALFAILVWQRRHWQDFFKDYQGWVIALIVLAILTFSNNWLSHDVYNYMFNAKMLVQYGQDPHVRVALDFATDDWVRFMHNTHTPAPYGHGWTYLSVLPYLAGMGKFLPTWWLFRVFSMLGVVLALFVVWRWGREEKLPGVGWKIGLIALSPLVLVEYVQNSHNDGWMMVGAVCAVWFARKFSRGEGSHWLVSSLIVWAASIYIKIASVALAPVLIALIAARWHKGVRRWFTLEHIATDASMLLFLPLLTPQSKWFLPWYLLWAVVWLPLIQKKSWWIILFGFAVAGSYRYIPWLWTGGYAQGETSAVLVTWVGGGVFSLLIWFVWAHMYNGKR